MLEMEMSRALEEACGRTAFGTWLSVWVEVGVEKGAAMFFMKRGLEGFSENVCHVVLAANSPNSAISF